MKDPTANMPLTTQVNKNVEHFIRRASMMGYVGENKDKVRTSAAADETELTRQNSMAQSYHATVTLINQASSISLLAQMPESFIAWY